MSNLKNTKERIAKSPNFIDGRAKNLEPMPSISSSLDNKKSMPKILFELFVNPNKPKFIPKEKSDFTNTEDFIVWFGHSSYMLQIEDKRFLIDPVLLGNASPLPFINTPFPNTEIDIESLPDIDYLIITHNHYDHLSKKTIKKLTKLISIKQAIVPLGVGKYLKSFGIDEEKIIELDWNENIKLGDMELFALSARHFSGRGIFDRDKSLWASFLLKTSEKNIFFGGDGGYGKHFREIGEKFGTIDLAILENGQYSEMWPSVHLFPQETLKAAKDLRTEVLMPVHNSKFKISFHDWDTPMRELDRLAQSDEFRQIRLLTPKIGEVIPLQQVWQNNLHLPKWWEEVK